jgi:hypothetical protein
MAKRKSLPSLTVGSVLSIPVRHNSFALGQIINEGTVFYLAIDPRERTSVSEEICSETVKFTLFSWTNDAEVYRGNWTAVAKCDIFPSEIYKPEYKMGINGELHVESFDGTEIRKFNPRIDSNLSYRTSSSPLLIQDAVQAFNGAKEWKPYYEGFLIRKS